MASRIIFTIVLIIVCIFSFYIGLKPLKLLATWQDQNSETETGIQKSLTEKSDQVLEVWDSLKSVHNAVNVLQSVDTSAVYAVVKPLEIFAPFDKTLKRISALYMFSYGFLTFEKVLLAVSISIILLVIAPVYILLSVFSIWKKKLVIGIYKIAIATVVTGLIILFALPASLKLSIFIGDKVLSENVNTVVSAIKESGEKADKMETELRGLRRVSVSIMNYVTNAQDMCNKVINDLINYLLMFFMFYIIIPALSIFGIYKITKIIKKLIL